MPDEKVLIESRSLRDSVREHTEALDRVKALRLLPDGLHVTTELVAEYFEVSRKAVENLLQRHREELTSNGLQLLRGDELRKYQALTLRGTSGAAGSYPQRRSALALYTRRTVLNVAMLLRDSPVARQVRAYLLDVEARSRVPGAGVREGAARPAAAAGSLETRVRNVELALADIGPALRDLGPVLHRMSARLEKVERGVARTERRLDRTERVVGAMSERLSQVATEVRELRDDRRG